MGSESDHEFNGRINNEKQRKNFPPQRTSFVWDTIDFHTIFNVGGFGLICLVPYWDWAIKSTRCLPQ